MKKVLMMAFHFPPQRGSSGIQRTLKFTQYLPALGWEPLVLTAHPRAYPDAGGAPYTGPAQVTRTFALDSARHLAVRGRYSRLLALPDRWASWVLGAVPAGLRLVRRARPAVLWSTYPIASAHLVALVLHRLTGLPWIADLRDPMIDAEWPADPWMRRASAWIERQTVRYCSRAVCTTPGAVRSYRLRYPELPPERFHLIENGYDEEDFAHARPAPRQPGGPFLLLHSGVVYPSERDPGPLFSALASLARAGTLTPDRFQLVLRAPGHDRLLADLAQQKGVAALVRILPPLAYGAALAEMLAADGLLVLQASNCNDQVPAKLYEYLRAGRPVLALTDPHGDTAGVMRAAGIDTVAPLDDASAIAAALQRFMALVEAGDAPLAPQEFVQAQARSARTLQLAELLDEVARQGAKLSKAP